jgi:hypothetical protein
MSEIGRNARIRGIDDSCGPPYGEAAAAHARNDTELPFVVGFD